MNFSSIWLAARWGATALWLLLFGVALAFTLGALWHPRSRRFHGAARALWAAAMAAFVLMWVAGAILEMIRRAWHAPLDQLLIAIALFSFLIAGVLALAREWFARPNPPETGEWKFDARRLAWTMSVLCALSWALGGLVLWPFETGSFRHAEALPWNFVLAWSGAQLAGAMALVSCPPAPEHVLNPRPALLWLLLFALVVGWLSPLCAGVAGSGFAAFLVCVWEVRGGARRPKWARWTVCLAPLGVLTGVLIWQGETVSSWLARQELWLLPMWLAAGAVFVLWLILVASGGRFAFALALHENASARALAWGAGVGTVSALLVFGVAGALFWSFWPLAALFFALLEWHDYPQRPAARAQRELDAPVAVSADGGSP